MYQPKGNFGALDKGDFTKAAERDCSFSYMTCSDPLIGDLSTKDIFLQCYKVPTFLSGKG